MAEAGAAGVIVHARKAWLEGLSPKDNRTVPPLDYPLVYELKAAHPALPIAVNGGIVSLAAANAHLDQVDGVMIGRAAYQNPELLLNVDPWIFGAPAPVADAFEALEAYEPYVARQLEQGVRLADMTRHILGLFAGRPGARPIASACRRWPRGRGPGWRRCAKRSPPSAGRRATRRRERAKKGRLRRDERSYPPRRALAT